MTTNLTKLNTILSIQKAYIDEGPQRAYNASSVWDTIREGLGTCWPHANLLSSLCYRKNLAMVSNQVESNLFVIRFSLC